MRKSNSITKTQKRLLIILISIAFLFCLLFVRLFYLQLIKGGFLSGKAADQWYRDIPLSAPRGDILDRDGRQLA